MYKQVFSVYLIYSYFLYYYSHHVLFFHGILLRFYICAIFYLYLEGVGTGAKVEFFFEEPSEVGPIECAHNGVRNALSASF